MAAKRKELLDVDIGDVQAKIDALRGLYTQKEFEKLMYAAFRRTGSHTKSIMQKELPEDYFVKRSEIGKAVGAPRMTTGAGNIGCCIPVRGKMRHIGGSVEAVGGIRGWESARLGGKKYKIWARIVRRGVSELPTEMEKHKENAPFRNLGAEKIGDVAYVRNSTGKSSFKKPGKNKFVSLTAVAVPQMPVNRSADDMQDSIRKKLYERIEHEHNWRFKRLKTAGKAK